MTAILNVKLANRSRSRYTITKSQKGDVMGKRAQVSRFIQHLGELTEKMPDKRAGRHNQIYALQDAVRGAFSIFSCKALLFLAHQRLMAQKRGRSNLESVFQMSRIPTDNHIRTLLDGVPASHFAGAYQWLWQQLVAEEKLAGFRALGGRLLVGIDGIQFFSSTKVHCPQCVHRSARRCHPLPSSGIDSFGCSS
ncbi:MAG: hypothetical protein IPM39_04105 [Chloroflexi bacterium]|nr:hypothetical protein [Chloroflexota bacterium]